MYVVIELIRIPYNCLELIFGMVYTCVLGKFVLHVMFSIKLALYSLKLISTCIIMEQYTCKGYLVYT